MERILLVDDDNVSRMFLSTLLQQAGYAVDEAPGGEAGLALLREGPPYAAVVTDRMMPKMNGLELFKLMQAEPRLRQIPVIMQTGADSPEEVRQGIEAGLYYYLVKPFQTESLLTLVKSAISDQRKSQVLEARFETQAKALTSLMKGLFEIKQLEEAQDLAFLLGCLFPRPELAVSGLYELLLNAIEHGNLSIGFAEKTRLLAGAQWEAAIRQGLAMPENADKKVTVQFAQTPERIEALITDMGGGFDWRPYLQIEPSRATQINGRGIAKANLLCFDQLSYLGTGNRVYVSSVVTP